MGCCNYEGPLVFTVVIIYTIGAFPAPSDGYRLHSNSILSSGSFDLSSKLFPKGLVLLTSIASSSTKSSSSKGDVLDGGGVSSKVTFKDSSTFIVDVSTALHQNFCGIDCSFNKVLLISYRVRFFLSTTPFDCGVRGAEKL
ncbi:hypothetical protein Tco_1476800 [Tanacetum coccineum]